MKLCRSCQDGLVNGSGARSGFGTELTSISPVNLSLSVPLKIIDLGQTLAG
jgi:hypothetical protein